MSRKVSKVAVIRPSNMLPYTSLKMHARIAEEKRLLLWPFGLLLVTFRTREERGERGVGVSVNEKYFNT